MAKQEVMTLEQLYASSDSVKKALAELFDIKCKHCGSSDVQIAHEEEINKTRGYYSSEYNEVKGKYWLALKCAECGQAKVVHFERDD